MVDKKTEGDEQQRRARARQARKAGSTPSAELVTTGASKQLHRTDRKDPHQEQLAAIKRGKQQGPGPQPPGRRGLNPTDEWSRPRPGRPPMAGGRGEIIDLSEEQAQVYGAVAELEASGEAVYLNHVADTVGRPVVETRRILGDLLDANLVQEVATADQPDFGFQYLLTAKT
jgi:hypothetical protein